jgi:ABC-type glutathione transport system ATPase component
MGEGPAALLAVEGLAIAFPHPSSRGWREVLSAVDFRIFPGQIVALTGASGSGKSLTALAIGRLLPAAARLSGKIVFEGEEIQNIGEKDFCRLRGRKISYVFQEPMACFNPSMSIGKQVRESLAIHCKDLAKSELRQHVLDWFFRLQIPDPMRAYGSYAHELSGGMLQRAMLAMALCNGPRLLIADEPTSALDGRSCRIAVEQLLLLRELLGFAVLFISHDIALAERIGDQLLLLDCGRIRRRPPTDGESHRRG